MTGSVNPAGRSLAENPSRASNASSLSAGSDGSDAGSSGSSARSTHDVQPPYSSRNGTVIGSVRR